MALIKSHPQARWYPASVRCPTVNTVELSYIFQISFLALYKIFHPFLQLTNYRNLYNITLKISIKFNLKVKKGNILQITHCIFAWSNFNVTL
jgi:hypothetical protein